MKEIVLGTTLFNEPIEFVYGRRKPKTRVAIKQVVPQSNTRFHPTTQKPQKVDKRVRLADADTWVENSVCVPDRNLAADRHNSR